MERTCKKCGETKLIEEFVGNKICKEGYEHVCKKCAKLKRTTNKETNTIYHKKWLLTHKGNTYTNRKKEYDKEYHKLNKIRLNNYTKEFVKNNYYKDGVNVYSAEYRKNNRDLIRKNITELGNSYIALLIVRSLDIDRETLKQHPELIENHKQLIKIKRLLKSRKNDKSIKTS